MRKWKIGIIILNAVSLIYMKYQKIILFMQNSNHNTYIINKPCRFSKSTYNTIFYLILTIPSFHYFNSIYVFCNSAASSCSLLFQMRLVLLQIFDSYFLSLFELNHIHFLPSISQVHLISL